MAAATFSRPLRINDPAAVAGWLMSVIYKASSRKLPREEQFFARNAMDYLFENNWDAASLECVANAHIVFQKLQMDGHADAGIKASNELNANVFREVLK